MEFILSNTDNCTRQLSEDDTHADGNEASSMIDDVTPEQLHVHILVVLVVCLIGILIIAGLSVSICYKNKTRTVTHRTKCADGIVTGTSTLLYVHTGASSLQQG